MPFFSIIIPVYNVESYLLQCFDSIIRQSYKDYEVIIVDDGSTDNSGRLCDKYEKNHRNFRVIHQENSGVSAARNKGVDLAVGKYIVFVDGDDLLNSGALLMEKKVILEHKFPDVIVNYSESFSENPDEKPQNKYSFDLSVLSKMNTAKKYYYCCEIKGFLCTPWSLVIKKKYLKESNISFPYNILNEDEHWFPKVFLNTNFIAFNNSCFYKYRVNRSGSLTQSNNIKKVFDQLWIVEDLIQESYKISYDKSRKQAFQYRCSQLVTGALRQLMKFKNHTQYDRLKKSIKNNLYILKNNKINKYKILYILCQLFGLELVSLILNMRERS